MFINTGKYLINSSNVYYTSEKAEEGFLLDSTGYHRVSKENYAAIKTGLESEPDFCEVPNFGFINLSKITFLDYQKDSKTYRIKFPGREDLVLIPEKVEDLDDTLYNKALEGALGKDDEESVEEATQLTVDPPSIADLTTSAPKSATVTTDADTISTEDLNSDKVTSQVQDKTITFTGKAATDPGTPAKVKIKAKASGKKETTKDYEVTVTA